MFGPEEINLGVVVDRQVQMEASISNLSKAIENLASSGGTAKNDSLAPQVIDTVMQKLEQRMSDFNADVNARLDHLSAVCSQLAENAATQPEPTFCSTRHV